MSVRAGLLLTAALGLLVLATPWAAQARERVSSQDRAATRAYLEAELTYQRALTAGAPAANAGFEHLADGLIGECQGVLVGAPRESAKALFESRKQTPRQTGESNRARRQLSDLQLELTVALTLPTIDADRQAAIAYARAIQSVRWSNTTLTMLEHERAALMEWQLQLAAPGACADMKAWQASGYRTLSPATKTFASEEEAREEPLSLLTRELEPSTSAAKLLARFEGSREKALSRELDAVERERESGSQTLAGLTERLYVALGLVSEAELREERESEAPPKGATVLAKAKSAVGGTYTIWLERKPQRFGRKARLCRLTLGVSETNSESSIEGGEKTVEFSTGFGREACLSRSHPEPASVRCDEGLLTIEAQTPAQARKVRLTLSDGRKLTSRVALLPPRLGGPLGFYYQVVRGPKPVPVAITELDRHGRVLRRVKLPRTKRCVAHPLRYLPGGYRRIVTASVAEGPSFSIVGERFRLGGHLQLELRLETGLQAESEGTTNQAGSIVEVGRRPRARPKPFELQVKTGCTPHEYAILFGVLRDRGDTVLAKSGSTATPLQRVSIPSTLHIPGVLAYTALPGVPNELVVHARNGKVVMREHLAALAQRSREVCEGEAERGS